MGRGCPSASRSDCLSLLKMKKVWPGGKGRSPLVRSEAATNYGPLEAAAYAVTRLPMTFGAQVRVMQELRAPGFMPVSLLDFGVGPTPALWAAREVFGNNIRWVRRVAPPPSPSLTRVRA